METKITNAPYYPTIISSLKSGGGSTESNVVCAVMENICLFSVDCILYRRVTEST